MESNFKARLLRISTVFSQQRQRLQKEILAEISNTDMCFVYAPNWNDNHKVDNSSKGNVACSSSFSWFFDRLKSLSFGATNAYHKLQVPGQFVKPRILRFLHIAWSRDVEKLTRLGKRVSWPLKWAWSIQFEIASLVCSVISNWTGPISYPMRCYGSSIKHIRSGLPPSLPLPDSIRYW